MAITHRKGIYIMADMWELAHYVEEHAEDHEQRWKLAKQLYAAWEYRLALEHLQVLKNEWQRKLNVVRYLAATYYRLGRYDEAIAELEEAIKTWPQEIGIREQYARVLEVAGRREEAIRAWEEITRLDSKHPIAANAVQRLIEKREQPPEQDLHLTDSDSGIDLSPGRICPNCGAQNSDEFDRCWQCHAQLFHDRRTPKSSSAMEERHAPMITAENISMASGIIVVALLALSLYLSLKLLAFRGGNGVFVSTLGELYNTDLAISRVLTGLALLFIWPAALGLTLTLVKSERPVPPPLIILTGLLMASFGYVCSWLPANLFNLTFILPPVFGLVIIIGAFGIGFLRALNVWALHLIIVLIAALAIFDLSESVQLGSVFNPVSEIPSIIEYSKAQKASATPGNYPVPGETIPIAHKMRWKSTGSPWLDKRAGETQFSVYCETENPNLKFEINQGETKPLVFEYVKVKQWT
ncbi:MAG TPA: tetratricopeptide repeat protein, partial [Candidatus Hydrogenedentes bacterium]|nr:tetratricopeptide repeat protein [Candidatus Hydrogenedentota bacterium]